MSIEEGSGVTVCVFWACARNIQPLCVCVKFCTESEVVSCFFRVYLERNVPPEAAVVSHIDYSSIILLSKRGVGSSHSINGGCVVSLFGHL